MNNGLLILPTLIAIFVLILIVKAASVALRLTGMDEKKAAFQALSAITGTGFTTRESEQIMHHPLRRRIISVLMVLGYAGFITIIVTFSTTIISSEGYTKYIGFIIFFAGLYIIYLLANYKGFTARWENFIRNKLIKSAAFEVTPVENLLRLYEGYGLIRVNINETSDFIGHKLLDMGLTTKNILILGIERNHKWMPVPKASEVIKNGDEVVVYGPIVDLKILFKNK